MDNGEEYKNNQNANTDHSWWLALARSLEVIKRLAIQQERDAWSVCNIYSEGYTFFKYN